MTFPNAPSSVGHTSVDIDRIFTERIRLATAQRRYLQNTPISFIQDDGFDQSPERLPRLVRAEPELEPEVSSATQITNHNRNMPRLIRVEAVLSPNTTNQQNQQQQ
jgi:hypothetical protein